MADSFFRPKGLDFPFYIKPRAGRYPAWRGTFEPLGVEASWDFVNAPRKYSLEDLKEYEITTLAGQLRSWNAGKTIDAQAVRDLPSDVFWRLKAIVLEDVESDVDPDLMKQPGKPSVDEAAKKND